MTRHPDPTHGFAQRPQERRAASDRRAGGQDRRCASADFLAAAFAAQIFGQAMGSAAEAPRSNPYARPALRPARGGPRLDQSA